MCFYNLHKISLEQHKTTMAFVLSLMRKDEWRRLYQKCNAINTFWDITTLVQGHSRQLKMSNVLPSIKTSGDYRIGIGGFCQELNISNCKKRSNNHGLILTPILVTLQFCFPWCQDKMLKTCSERKYWPDPARQFCICFNSTFFCISCMETCVINIIGSISWKHKRSHK